MIAILVVLSALSFLAGLAVLLLAVNTSPPDPTIWGVTMCLLAGGGVAPVIAIFSLVNESRRRARIKAHEGEWGADVCQHLIAKRIGPGMTKAMVAASWGNPDNVDEKEITSKSQRERWVYGTPRRGANYIWFKDGIVSKVKT